MLMIPREKMDELKNHGFEEYTPKNVIGQQFLVKKEEDYEIWVNVYKSTVSFVPKITYDEVSCIYNASFNPNDTIYNLIVSGILMTESEYKKLYNLNYGEVN